MAYLDEAVGRSPARTAVAAVLVIVGILCVIAGVIYFTEPAHSLPAILGHIPLGHKAANSHRSLRGSVALGVGVVLVIAGGFAWFWKGRDRY